MESEFFPTSERMMYTKYMTPAPPHLLGVPPTTSASLSLSPQQQQGHACSATLSNPSGTTNIPDVFVTPPGMMAVKECSQWSHFFLFPAVPGDVSDIQLPSSPLCLVNGTTVDIQCVVSGFPRPNVFFYKETEQIFPGVAPFINFESVDGENDTVKLTVTQQEDSGDYLCKAKRGDVVVGESPTKRLMFCSK